MGRSNNKVKCPGCGRMVNQTACPYCGRLVPTLERALARTLKTMKKELGIK